MKSLEQIADQFERAPLPAFGPLTDEERREVVAVLRAVGELQAVAGPSMKAPSKAERTLVTRELVRHGEYVLKPEPSAKLITCKVQTEGERAWLICVWSVG